MDAHTKKQIILARVKRTQLIERAIALHKESAAKMYVARGGYSKVKPGEGISNEWQDKVGSLRKRLSSSRMRIQERAKSRGAFRSK